MVTKKTGISRDLIIHPGETIADILEERCITQAELAARMGVSCPYVSSVIAGKKNISSDFATRLEYALGVPKSFWLNLQAHYTAELLEFEAANTVTQAELSILPVLHEITAWLRSAKLIPDAQDDKSTVLALRKMLRLSNISSLAESAEPIGAFRMSKSTSTNPIVMNAWLQLCKTLCERDTAAIPPFDVQNVDALIHDLKQVMISSSSDIQDDLTKLMSRYGIKFRIMKNFKGAPVHGYVSQNKYGEYQMILTIRGAFADIFWFSLFHEIGHIVNGDVSKSASFIDATNPDATNPADTAKEAAADLFARDALLDPASYAAFVSGGRFSSSAIKQYADAQGVAPFVVVGRLQKEEIIPYVRHANLKPRYKWVDS